MNSEEAHSNRRAKVMEKNSTHEQKPSPLIVEKLLSFDTKVAVLWVVFRSTEKNNMRLNLFYSQ